MSLERLIIVFFIIALFGCQSKNDKIQETSQIVDTIVRRDTVTYGDSLRIIYKYIGDTVFQKRIDLKGVEDDGFDNSFSVKSIWSTMYPTELDCTRKLKLSVDSIEFEFCIQDALKYTVGEIIKAVNKPWISSDLEKTIQELIAFKNYKIDSLTIDTYRLTFEFLRNIDCSIYDYETNLKVDKIRIEKYETEFSGGYNYFLISNEKDTIARFHINEWMR